MNRDLSTVRLYSMRFLYLFNGIVLGIGAWPEIINPGKPWDLIHSVAFSLYAAYSLLMLLGVRLPIRMLPLLLLQVLYKLIWLAGVAYPMWSAGHLDLVSGTVKLFAIVVVLDLTVIPWPYVFQNYVRSVFKGEGKHASLPEEVGR
ncbi:MAG: hypothetical protein ABSE56_16205 [Bryobacteraceae bacterium]